MQQVAGHGPAQISFKEKKSTCGVVYMEPGVGVSASDILMLGSLNSIVGSTESGGVTSEEEVEWRGRVSRCLFCFSFLLFVYLEQVPDAVLG